MRKLFVYGTLMRDFGNHPRLADATFLGEAHTLPTYRLISLGGYPGLLPEGNQAVVGEVYEVNDAIIRGCDALEGHPHFYRRTPVKLNGWPDGVEAYILHDPEFESYPTVGGGDWRNRKEAWKWGVP